LAAASLARWVAPVAAGALAVLAAGCVARDHPEQRNAALTAIVDSLGLEPLPGDDAVKRGETEIKSGDPYFTATGVLDGSREEGVRRIEAALEEQGFPVFESGPEPVFLGWCVRGQSGDMVAISYVGWATGSNTYPRLPGRVYVQTSVGNEDPIHGWTDPERPTCGA
jgi:hypothetical protein